jgi:hypothetical protein
MGHLRFPPRPCLRWPSPPSPRAPSSSPFTSPLGALPPLAPLPAKPPPLKFPSLLLFFPSICPRLTLAWLCSLPFPPFHLMLFLFLPLPMICLAPPIPPRLLPLIPLGIALGNTFSTLRLPGSSSTLISSSKYGLLAATKSMA